MERKFRSRLILFVLLFSFFDVVFMESLTDKYSIYGFKGKEEMPFCFRDHILNDQIIDYMKKAEDPGKVAGLYLAESKFSCEKFHGPYSSKKFKQLVKKWEKKEEWNDYIKICHSIWNDLKYFPVPFSKLDRELTVSYEDSWMNERTYGGRRGHEGTDILASKNKAGVYPIVSMTDGIVTNLGWLEKGGYRVGITSPSGGYYYYAHLDSYADLSIHDQIKAGEILGYMGNTGYGKEGTKGKFPVHLHLGIYVQHDDKEISINPYWILKYLDQRRLEYFYS